jgi:hypothetical protein
MTIRHVIGSKLILFTVISMAGVLLSGSPAAAQSYGGSATGAIVTVPTTGTTIRAATGTEPISGGGEEAGLLVGDIPSSATGGVVGLGAGVMHSAIVGLDATRAEASMDAITLTISNNTITASFIMARGTASCGPAVTGSAILSNLVINGQSITVTGNPNQTVTLPNGTAVINEQTSSISGTTGQITVNALHVTTTDPVTHQQLADAILAQAAPQIGCSGTPATGAFGTGGGWVLSNDGVDQATFGVVGGTEPDNSVRGHLEFHDHGSLLDYKLTSTSIDSPVTSSGCTTTFSGTGTSTANGVTNTAVTFTVTISDNGNPPGDTFNLQTSDAYQNNNTTVVQGHIQQHSASCPQ